MSTSKEDHSDTLRVSNPKGAQPRHVSVNSTSSGKTFSSCPGRGGISDSETDHNDTDCQLEKRARKVFYIAEEIKKSEEVFVDVLKLLNIDFRNFIMTAENHDHALIPNEMLNRILDFLPQLHEFSEELLHDITKRIENWKENPKVSDIFVRKGPFLKLYSSYICNFENANKLLEEACSLFPDFQNLVKDFETSSRCARLPIKHYLVKPIQRIPQYKMLLQDYLNHLSEDSPDHEHTLTALKIVSEVADHANESLKQGDTLQNLLKIQNSLVGQFEVIQPGRILIKNGQLQKLSRKVPQPRMFYLFNDVLLVCTDIAVSGGYKVNKILPLSNMKVSTPQKEDFSNEFSILSVQRSFTVAASTLAERDEWLHALNEAIEKITSRWRTFKREGPQTSLLDENLNLGHMAPVWVPDARVTKCKLCLGDFTFIFRRHHCRACGSVVCDDCSDNTATLPYSKDEKVRVCDECSKKLQEAVNREDGQSEEGVTVTRGHPGTVKHLVNLFDFGNSGGSKRPDVLKKTSLLDKEFNLGHKAPVWMPDARVTKCKLCLGDFTFIFRRHHCRACGSVVCGDCSDNTATLPYSKDEKVRVCDECSKKLLEVVDGEDGQAGVTVPRGHPGVVKHLIKLFDFGNSGGSKRPDVLKKVRANDEGTDMHGYLSRLKNEKWNRLWFVIKDKILYTYKASEDMAAIEHQPLVGFEVTRMTVGVEGSEPGLVFQLTHDNTQPHIFRTESTCEIEKWVTAMRESSVE